MLKKAIYKRSNLVWQFDLITEMGSKSNFSFFGGGGSNPLLTLGIKFQNHKKAFFFSFFFCWTCIFLFVKVTYIPVGPFLILVVQLIYYSFYLLTRYLERSLLMMIFGILGKWIQVKALWVWSHDTEKNNISYDFICLIFQYITGLEHWYMSLISWHREKWYFLRFYMFDFFIHNGNTNIKLIENIDVLTTNKILAPKLLITHKELTSQNLTNFPYKKNRLIFDIKRR